MWGGWGAMVAYPSVSSPSIKSSEFGFAGLLFCNYPHCTVYSGNVVGNWGYERILCMRAPDYPINTLV